MTEKEAKEIAIQVAYEISKDIDEYVCNRVASGIGEIFGRLITQSTNKYDIREKLIIIDCNKKTHIKK